MYNKKRKSDVLGQLHCTRYCCEVGAALILLNLYGDSNIL